jgi:hypothetical protein
MLSFEFNAKAQRREGVALPKFTVNLGIIPCFTLRAYLDSDCIPYFTLRLSSALPGRNIIMVW